MSEKQRFLDAVEAILAEHPDWFADVILTMQSGIIKRVEIEMEEKARRLSPYSKYAPVSKI